MRSGFRTQRPHTLGKRTRKVASEASEMGHNLTHALQQNRPLYSISSSARAYCVSGMVRAHGHKPTSRAPISEAVQACVRRITHFTQKYSNLDAARFDWHGHARHFAPPPLGA
jgi:hypothetical protein